MPLGACRATPPRGSFAGSVVTFSRKHRYVASMEVRFSRKHRYSTGELVFSRKHRYVAANTVAFSRRHRYTAYPGGYLEVVQGRTPTGATVPAGAVWPGDYDMVLTAEKDGDTREIERGHILDLDFMESAPAKWTLSIVDEDGSYSPENAESEWYGWLDRHAFNGSAIEYARKLRATITHGGITEYFTGVPVDYGYAFNNIDGKIYFQWMGVDTSHVLFRPAQNMQTVRSTRDAVRWSRDVAAELLDTYGIQHDLSALENYMVPLQHRQNKPPIKWLADGPISILGVPVCEWQVFGETFRPYRPVVLPKENAHFTYDLDSDCVQEMTVRASDAGQIVNILTGIRARDNSVQAKTQACKEWRQYEVTFDVPYSGISWDYLTQYNGVFSNFEGYDEMGVLRVASQSRAGSYPADVQNANWHRIKTVKFTWGQPDPSITDNSTSFAEIEFYGHPADDPNVYGAISDPVFTFTRDRSTSNSGEFPKELPPNPLIPDSSWLTRHVDRMLDKLGREQKATGAKVPFNLALRPGMTIWEKGGRARVNRAVYVKRVKHRVALEPHQRYTTYEAVEYL